MSWRYITKISEMKKLIEDYKKKLEEAMNLANKELERSTVANYIYKAKASCYRTFITELERIEKEENK